MNAAILPRRVVLIGTSCAGKSTLAQSLNARCGHALIELDALHWGAGWQPKPSAEFRHLVTEAAKAECWIAEGNYAVVRDLLWPRAQAVIWLNYSFPCVFGRALRRTVKRSLTGERLWHDNRETVWQSFFTRESMLWWVITTHRRRQQEFAALRASGEFAQLVWIEFRHPRETALWLASLAPSVAGLPAGGNGVH